MQQTDNALQHGFAIQGKKNTYFIERTLGQGTFGITYLAKYKTKIKGEMGSGQVTVQVAIKEFFMKELNQRNPESSSLHDDSSCAFAERYRRSFIREAHKMSKLEHPNITHVFEVIEANNTAYIVMEYIEGGNLDDYIRQQGSIEEQEALNLFVQIAHAIEYMHSKKMLHLDLKPKNTMLDEEGICHIIDFGLSKEYNEEGEPESDTSLGLGTPGYAPIEQCEHHEENVFSAAIDIYALGGTLYKMLTGTTPPKASTVLNSPDVIGQQLRAINISEQTIRVIERAMQPAARQRFQTVEEMINALKIDASVTFKKKGNKHKKTSKSTNDVKDYGPKVQNKGPRNYQKIYKWMPSIAFCLLFAVLTFTGIRYGGNILSSCNDNWQTTDNDSINSSGGNPTDTLVTDKKSREESKTETNDSTSHNKHIPAKPKSGTIDLGYAIWNGSLLNGQPHGQGKMTYKTSHPLYDEGDHTAEPGDVVNGTFEDGHWFNTATWTSKSQGKTFTISF